MWLWVQDGTLCILPKKALMLKGLIYHPKLCADQAREAGVTLKARVADLEIDYHIEKGGYDVIICFNYLQRSLITQIKDGLRVGGIVVYETFTVDQAQLGKPTNPNYLLEHKELFALFRDFRCLYYREGIVEERKALASIIAKKLYTT